MKDEIEKWTKISKNYAEQCVNALEAYQSDKIDNRSFNEFLKLQQRAFQNLQLVKGGCKAIEE